MSVLKTYGDDTVFATSRTYRLDGDRIMGMTDGKEAVFQAIELALTTGRWQHGIYSGDYGCEIHELFGHDSRPMEKEIELLMREALEQDDRITEVKDFRVDYKGDTAEISFTAVSRFGDIQVERSVLVG